MLTDIFTLKQLHTCHVVHHYIKPVRFWLKHNGLAIAPRTTKLIEGGHRGLQDNRHICYHFYVFYVFRVFLADRTNYGRAIGTVLRLSVCLSSVTLCIVAKRCVLEQKLLLRAYRKSYMRNRFVPK